MASFWAELKRRKVVRVATVYLVVAWAIIQIADTIAPRVALPGWTVTLVIVLAALGFPIALVFAWIFDITPQGIERTSPLAVTPALRRGLWFVLGFAVAVMGGWYAWSRRSSMSAETVNANLIAVLPFRVNAADASLSYLREG